MHKLGMPANINIQVRPARDYPVDLYILMDMSRSMLPHLERLKTIATQLGITIRNLSSQSSFGFGTFVDKPVTPFGFGAKRRQSYPCSFSDSANNIPCDPTYLFRNGRPLTTDIKEFQQGIDQQNISSNSDAPEGGLEALLQVSVCPQHIGWRRGARHIVVYCTDGFFHYAGDSKLAGIFLPNDGACHINSENKYQAALDMVMRRHNY
ncbi:uncharacterized protein TRIADDRAFT_23256 [Trichoplax adhaerens]|uniref:Integrin beta n=1 Tax=Trichoplax adhaerens TaxID=10228 RepID=B3RT85_TRIAD|nr:hypothetical protein TRIADDRAFT_23256 [Trichoplax adhaerens]EDV27179.1 hypothetical protein TRIADDRAFT_23256 [Trichoplax adhaerens]|eukprot:XP_002111175.1 hypothetical protein TRIADDRAFT_23256 [Trichoplax adhaerens]